MLSLDLSKDHIADCTDRATKIVAGVDDVLTSLESDALFAFLRDKYLNEEPARHIILSVVLMGMKFHGKRKNTALLVARLAKPCYLD
jgi:hypothetical protein